MESTTNAWPYIRPPLPDGPPARETAQRYLAACCAHYGSQTTLARLCGVPLPYVNRLLRQDVPPSLPLAESLERVLGIPRGWWRPVGRGAAVAEVRSRLKDEGWPGQLAGRCGVTPEELEAVLSGRMVAPERMRALAASAFRVPWGAWDE